MFERIKYWWNKRWLKKHGIIINEDGKDDTDELYVENEDGVKIFIRSNDGDNQ